jgi:hypothetical protein
MRALSIPAISGALTASLSGEAGFAALARLVGGR